MKSVLIPVRLYSPLNGAHGHWSVKAGRRKAERSLTCNYWLAEKMPRQLEPGQRVRITRLGPRALDSDNLAASAKSIRDAVAEMLGINDRLDIWSYAQERGPYGVRVELIEPREESGLPELVPGT